MLRYYLNTRPLKKILQFQGRICFFFIKNTQKLHSSASDWWEDNKSSFKENVRTFPKISTTQENIRLKEDCKTYTKKPSNQKLSQ